MPRRRSLLVVLLVAAALGTGATAFAASPRQQQYGNPLPVKPAGTIVPKTPTTTGSGGTPSAPAGTPKPVSVSGSGLPFTGVDLTVFALLGGAIVICGLLARRLGRRGG